MQEVTCSFLHIHTHIITFYQYHCSGSRLCRSQIFLFAVTLTGAVAGIEKLLLKGNHCTAKMEHIERKWPREQPWWFSAAASDQLAAFKRKLGVKCSSNTLPNHKVRVPLIPNKAAWLFFHLDYSAGSVYIHLDDCTDQYLTVAILQQSLIRVVLAYLNNKVKIHNLNHNIH